MIGPSIRSYPFAFWPDEQRLLIGAPRWPLRERREDKAVWTPATGAVSRFETGTHLIESQVTGNGLYVRKGAGGLELLRLPDQPPFPPRGTYRVRGVAPDDLLNLRGCC